jgi:hypothetical protein
MPPNTCAGMVVPAAPGIVPGGAFSAGSGTLPPGGIGGGTGALGRTDAATKAEAGGAIGIDEGMLVVGSVDVAGAPAAVVVAGADVNPGGSPDDGFGIGIGLPDGVPAGVVPSLVARICSRIWGPLKPVTLTVI